MGLNEQPAFIALKDHYKTFDGFHLRQALQDQGRYKSLVLAVGDAIFDFSKHLVTPQTITLLLALAEKRDVAGWREKMFVGAVINNTEGRGVLHTALRASADADIRFNGENVMPGITETRARMAIFAEKIRRDKNITDVVSIGIGGSDLGPRFVTEALRDFHDGPDIHFVSNVDGHAISRILANLNPQNTLVVIASKTFTTEETMLNAAVAREWLAAGVGKGNIGTHLVALSVAVDKAMAFGITPDRIFGFADWVGGRYSLWSAIGLPIMLAIGPQNFDRLLDGARTMDDHFRTASLDRNTPARLAMMDVFLHTALGIPNRTVLAYAHRLRKLPDFLQQLEMESNGKSAADDDAGLVGRTAPMVWGSVGTLGQHSFHQLLHQGMRDSAIEFVASRDAGAGDIARGRALLANAFAQAEGLLAGRSAAEAETQLAAQGKTGPAAKEQARHMHMPGNRGSTTVLLDTTAPEAIGALIAMYEHRTFAAGILWGINPFDQWGVERGKVLAEELDKALAGADPGKRDPSTLRLVSRAKR